jgi:hypothetical protein
VYNAIKDGKEKGKSAIGYTVQQYQGVLADLDNIRIVYNDVVVSGVSGVGTGSVGKNYYTRLG